MEEPEETPVPVGAPEPDEEPEPDDPDAEPDEDEDEEPEEPEAEERQTVQSLETIVTERHKAMNAAAKTHETRLRSILGDDFEQYNPCPLCLGDAFLVPTPPGAMAPEQWEAIQLAAGMYADENYREADYTETCETCGGYGQVLSGSKDPTQRLIVCRPCEGKGWKAKLGEPVPTPIYNFPGPPTTTTPLPYNTNGPQDSWGRPAGHPHFGIEPALVTA